MATGISAGQRASIVTQAAGTRRRKQASKQDRERQRNKMAHLTRPPDGRARHRQNIPCSGNLRRAMEGEAEGRERGWESDRTTAEGGRGQRKEGGLNAWVDGWMSG
ncbi:hypothetical protein MGYG_03547 [Nannizzia gypsea CBS 118893]|uniref:Uncharacterized protein n=1 Tax=Arthroderma gypseum (strain ATCC MYA-4604 / CBS 118893) TaxID=535722 RepID=E4USH6_ARTGP|nr:hypothetical protein MGYG_03547 [Nannizzia gypsea CBS 118893]EFR00543.1 hypothetical protein MGYG_03547 [Nannizzia gypsea CBS 118893]